VKRYSNMDEMLFGAYTEVFSHGTRSSPRGQETLEVIGWTAQLTKPRARIVRNPARDIRLGYCAASVAWNLDKRNDVESICWWNPNGRFMSDNGQTFHGANYGQRWDLRLQEAMQLFFYDSSTRRAWVPIWEAIDDLIDVDPETGEFDAYSREGKDVPCTLGFGLRNRERHLDMHVVMRSQSVTILPYDVFLFSTLQELVANSLQMKLGVLTWHAMSLHAYFKREWATNRASYEWYLANTHREGAIRAETYRSFQEEMQPVNLTLEEAKAAWPPAMDACAASPLGPSSISNDRGCPIVELMVSGALRTWDIGAAQAPVVR